MENEFTISAKHVAKWALPNEGIPLYLTWKGNICFDYIDIQMPGELAIREFYNAKLNSESRKVLFTDLKKNGYIGFVFTSPAFDILSSKSLSKVIKITLKFIKDSRILHEEEFETRIIRPMITLEDAALDGLKVTDNEQISTNLQLKYSGYGNVYGKIIVTDDKNKLFLDPKNLNDLYLVIANYSTFKEFMRINNINEEEFLGRKIPIDQYEYRQLLLALSQLGEFTSGAFFHAVKTVIDNKKMEEILQKTLEQNKDITVNLFRSIIDFVEKRPVEGVFLSDSQIEPMELEKGTKSLFLCVCYVDDFGNYYKYSRVVDLDITQKRTINFGAKWTEKAGSWQWLKVE